MVIWVQKGSDHLGVAIPASLLGMTYWYTNGVDSVNVWRKQYINCNKCLYGIK